MCYYVDTFFVLANVLARSGEGVTIKQLKEKRRNIEASVASVYVDVSLNSICSSIELHPDMFRWKQDVVARAENSERYFDPSYLDEYVNSMVPGDICSDILQVLA